MDQKQFERDCVLHVGTSETLQFLQNKNPLSYLESVCDCELNTDEYQILEQCGLTGVQFACVYLRYFEGLKLEDIGEKLGISHPAVIKYIKLAKKKIKPILEILINNNQY